MPRICRANSLPDSAALQRLIEEHGLDLYLALETMIRQHAGGYPIGHDAIVAGRRVLAASSGRAGQQIDWAQESISRARPELRSLCASAPPQEARS